MKKCHFIKFFSIKTFETQNKVYINNCNAIWQHFVKIMRTTFVLTISIFFYEKHINIGHSIMTTLWTTKCCSINKLNGSLKIFPEFFWVLWFSKKFLQNFPDFLNFSNFPDFLGFPWVLWTLLKSYILKTFKSKNLCSFDIQIAIIAIIMQT